MRWLKHAIGRVLGITQHAGHVAQTEDYQIGGDNNTAEHKLQHASKESKAKRSRALADTQAPSRKTGTSRAPTRTKKSLETGTQQTTVVPPPAKSKPKRKASAAQPTTAAVSRKRKPKAAQAVPGETGSQPQTHAPRTRQHAKRQPKPKQ